MTLEFKAAMFDMDGTLLHTMRYWRLSAVEMLLGRNIFPSPDQMARLWNTSSRTICREALEEHGVELSDAQMQAEMNQYMLRHYRLDAQPKAGVQVYLEKLRRAGIPMCIATAAPAEFAREALERLGLAQYFAFITDCNEQEMRKDDPAFFHRMAARFGVEAGEMCVFEDALYSIRGAKAAGCPVIAICDHAQMHDWEEIRSAADLCVNEYSELL